MTADDGLAKHEAGALVEAQAACRTASTLLAGLPVSDNNDIAVIHNTRTVYIYLLIVLYIYIIIHVYED